MTLPQLAQKIKKCIDAKPERFERQRERDGISLKCRVTEVS